MAKNNTSVSLEVFKKSLEGKSVDDLKKIEEEIIKEADALDKEIAVTTFDLPEENYFEVANTIRYFLEGQTVNWQYTLGMLSMYEAWDEEKKPKNIAYPVLDSTLRTLGQMQFKGHDEWQKVIAVNKYLEPLRDKYVETSQKVFTMAEKHQALMQAQEAAEGKEALNSPVVSK